jgi:hypothetical protein
MVISLNSFFSFSSSVIFSYSKNGNNVGYIFPSDTSDMNFPVIENLPSLLEECLRL